MFTAFGRTIFVVIALVISAPLFVSAAGKPNVVFILADDLGYRELGSFGQRAHSDSALDELARQGMRLTQHYSGNAVCAPSRCVLMTGKNPGHAYVRNNRGMPTEGQFPIPDSEVTLAELMQQNGYVTGAFGKWGLGGPESTGRPLNQGVDRFFGYNCQSVAHSYYPTHLWDDDHKLMLNNSPPIPGHANLAKGADKNDPRSYDEFKGTDYAPDRINEQVLNFIRDHRGRAVLFVLSVNHSARRAADSRRRLETLPGVGLERPTVHERIRRGLYTALYSSRRLCRDDHTVGSIRRQSP